MAFEDYIQVLKEGGDKFPPKYIVAKHKDAIFASLRQAQYLSCLHYNILPKDVQDFMDEVSKLVNEMENYKPRPAIVATPFAVIVETSPCGYCGSTKGTYMNEDTLGHKACIECGGV